MKQKMFPLMLCLFVTSLSTATIAKDYGVQGHTFEIIEQDILSVIEERLKKIDIQELQNKSMERTRQYAESPPSVEHITTYMGKDKKVSYYDPTYTLDRDIFDHKGTMIHKLGTQVNPLDHVSLSQALIFIDGSDERQVDFALKIQRVSESGLKIILVKGRPLDLMREHKIPIYFDQRGILTTKLGIKEVPALVEQDKRQLKISIEGIE